MDLAIQIQLISIEVVRLNPCARLWHFGSSGGGFSSSEYVLYKTQISQREIKLHVDTYRYQQTYLCDTVKKITFLAKQAMISRKVYFTKNNSITLQSER